MQNVGTQPRGEKRGYGSKWKKWLAITWPSAPSSTSSSTSCSSTAAVVTVGEEAVGGGEAVAGATA